MSRYELRFLARHPLAWARRMWLHLLVTVLLATLSAAWAQEIFSQVTFAAAWPMLLSWLAGLVIATAIVPFDRVLLAVTSSAMMTLALLRTATLLEVLYVGTAARPVVVALLAKEGFMFALGAAWPVWTRACGSRVSVDAGWDDRGAKGA